MKHLLEEFMEQIALNKLEIYNEFSFQHELGIFLRAKLVDKKIQFERNVSFFGLDKTQFTKREIDICIYDDKEYIAAIELKFPRNGQIPEQMYSFCKDIKFLEELKNAVFKSTYFLAYTEDKYFFSGQDKGIYSYFRSSKELSGVIKKPTGKKSESLSLEGRYFPTWKNVNDKGKYYLEKIEITN